MPEPGRVLTRDEVKAMVFSHDGRKRLPYVSEAQALARSHEQLREQVLMERGLAASFIPADRHADWQERLQAFLSAGEETP